MKKLLFSLLLLVAIAAVAYFIGNNSKKQTSESMSLILEEPLVQQALKQLPEADDLGVVAVIEDSTDVTILFADQKTDNVDIMFTTIFGDESLFLRRGCPGGKTLELYFTYENGVLSVDGSKIYSSSDTTKLEKKDISKIVRDGYKLKIEEEDNQPLVKT